MRILSEDRGEQMELNKSKSSAEANSVNEDENSARAEDNEDEMVENEQNS